MPIKELIKLDLTSVVKLMSSDINNKSVLLKQLCSSVEKEIQQVLNLQEYSTAVQILYLKLKIVSAYRSQNEIAQQLAYNPRSHKLICPFYVLSDKFQLAGGYSELEFLFIQGIVKSLYSFATEINKQTGNFNTFQLCDDIAKHYGFMMSELW
jgi:hypothetical protein